MFGKQMSAGLCSNREMQKSSVLLCFSIAVGHPATGPPPSEFFLAMLSLHCCRWAFFSCGAWRLFSSCGTQASHCGGSQALGHVGFSSCTT